MRSIIRVTDWERASLARRISLAFVRVAILIALVTLLINVLGPPIGIFFITRWEARRVPGVRVAPQPLADYSVSSRPTSTLSYFGYEFQVPWNANFKVKAMGKGGLVQLQFDSGQNITFIVPADQRGLLTEIVQDRSLNMANLQPVLGELTNSPPHDQYAALLNTTPQSIRAFGPRALATRGVTLLTIKAIALGPGLPTGVFSFEFHDKRGFQIGDPQKSKRVDLEVFGMGGHQVEMILFAGKDNATLSQAEINRIITSLRSVAADSSAVAAESAAGPLAVSGQNR